MKHILTFSLLLSSTTAVWYSAFISRVFRPSNLSPLSNNVRLHMTDALSGLLDEMVYSGDMVGFIKRRTSDVLKDDFIEFLEEKLEDEETDEDEKNIISEALNIIMEKQKLTDGLGDQVGIVFETRLDKILFKSPNQRLKWIEENVDDITPGFVDYVQKELSATPDQDNKVVLASVLQMIGQVKGQDFLGKEVSILSRADSSLGDQFTSNSSIAGLEAGTALMSLNEQVLAGLMFSKNDILEDVLNNLQYLDDQFLAYLQVKIESAQDMEERAGLTSLYDTISKVKDRVREAREEGLIDEQSEELGIEDVRRRMQEVQSGQELDAKNKTHNTYAAFSVQKEKRDTFLNVLKRFQDLPADMDLAAAVQYNYDLCDKEFMESLQAEVADCLSQGADIEAQQYQDILNEISKAMADRMNTAQMKIQAIFEKGKGRGESALNAMETEIVAMGRRNELDEALVLLMEANQQQAVEAGATKTADILKTLLKRIIEQREKSLPDEQRLLRSLMRIENSEERKGLLFAAFKPTKTLSEDGGFLEGPPLIAPPAFISIVRTFMTSFGNVESFDIMGRTQKIILEAEQVATDLYGPGLSPRQQQDLMFNKKTISVWDLGNYEDLAMMSGEDVPWRNDKYDDKGPDDVIGERVRRVGGSGDNFA